MEREQPVALNDEDCQDIDIAPKEDGTANVQDEESQTDRLKIIHIKAGTTNRDTISVCLSPDPK